MTKDNKGLQDLETRLILLGSLGKISTGIDKAKIPSARATLYETAADIIAGPNQIEVDGKKVDNDAHSNLIKELRYGPEYAQSEINGVIDHISSEMQDDYKKYEKNIQGKIEISINSFLAEAENKAEAAQILGVYLTDFIDLKDPTQAEADEAANKDFRERLGIPYAFDQVGDIGKYNDVMTRAYLSDYLVESKDKKSYKVDMEKVNEKFTFELKDVARLYVNTKSIDKTKKADKSKPSKK